MAFVVLSRPIYCKVDKKAWKEKMFFHMGGMEIQGVILTEFIQFVSFPVKKIMIVQSLHFFF